MSTRANVVVLLDETRVYLYRHMDGYPAGLGVDLLEKLSEAEHDPSRFVELLLAERYEQQSYEERAKRIYELTTDTHGDIEYLYVVRFDPVYDRDLQVGYAARGRFENPPPNLSRVMLGTKADFAEAVNRDIRATNARLAKLRKEQPAVYGPMADAPEVRA